MLVVSCCFSVVGLLVCFVCFRKVFTEQRIWKIGWVSYPHPPRSWVPLVPEAPRYAGEKLTTEQKSERLGESPHAPKPRPHPASAVSLGRNLRLRPKPSSVRLSIFPPKPWIRLLHLMLKPNPKPAQTQSKSKFKASLTKSNPLQSKYISTEPKNLSLLIPYHHNLLTDLI